VDVDLEPAMDDQPLARPGHGLVIEQQLALGSPAGVGLPPVVRGVEADGCARRSRPPDQQSRLDGGHQPVVRRQLDDDLDLALPVPVVHLDDVRGGLAAVLGRRPRRTWDHPVPVVDQVGQLLRHPVQAHTLRWVRQKVHQRRPRPGEGQVDRHPGVPTAGHRPVGGDPLVVVLPV
jgi:hypothetical protein